MLIYTLLLVAGALGLVTLAFTGFLHEQGHDDGHHALPHGHHGAHGHDAHGHDAHGHDAHGHDAHGPHAHGHHTHGHAGAQGQAGTHGHAGTHTPTALVRSGAGHVAHSASSGGMDVTPDADGDGDGDGDQSGSMLQSGLHYLMPFLSPLNWFSWFLGAGVAGLIATRLLVPEPFTAGIALLGALGFNRGVVKPIWRLIFSFASKPAGGLQECLLQQVEAVTSFNARGEGLVRVIIDGHSTDILARLTRAELERGRRIKRGDRLLIEDVDPRTNSCRVSKV